MSNFLFSQSAPEERDENFGPPTERFVEYVTLKESPMERNEVVRMHEYVERSMKTVPYVVQSESDFDYMYENGEYASTGADQTVLDNGDEFSLVYTKDAS